MIHLRTLGSLDLRNEDGRECCSVLAQPKRFALLAYLAAASPFGFHRRDTLLGLFWPDSNEEAARASLRTALSVLRRSLGGEVLAARGSDEIGIDPDHVWCDVAAFEQALAVGELERALELYHTDLLQGFYIPDAPGFERWLEERRAELRQKAAAAAWRLVEREEEKGNPAVAAHWARRGAGLALDDEGALRRLIAVLDRTGDRAGALCAYEAFTERLRTEYEVGPCPETQALIQSIRGRESIPPAVAAPKAIVAEIQVRPGTTADGELVEEAVPVADAAPEPTSAQPSTGTAPGSWQLRARGGGRRGAVASVAVALILLLSALVYLPGTPISRVAAGSVLPGPTDGSTASSIAVLPFADMSAERDQEYFADGMAEEIINALARVDSLRVVARTSAFSYKGLNADVREIGRQLDVEAVLEGSVRKSEGRVRITVQLIDTRTGYHLWSESYDREAREVFAIQDEIARTITKTLTGRFVGAGSATAVSRSTADLEAYDHYLRGLHFLKRGAQDDLRKAVQQFEAATTADPHYALAYAGLADAYIQFPTLGILAPRDAFARARPAAQKALEIDGSLAEAHATLARVQFEDDWDFPAAGRSYERAIQLNPNFALYFRYPLYLVAVGRLDEAIVVTRESLRRDPISPWANSRMALLLYFDRQHDRAIEHLRKTLELEPGDFYARWYLGLAYMQKQMFDEAITEIQTAFTLSGGSPLVRATLGCAYARSGRREEALTIRDELLNLTGELYLRPQGMIFLLSDLGEREEAFRWLERAVEDRSIHPYVFTTEPLLDPLRADPRFVRLLRRAGLPSN